MKNLLDDQTIELACPNCGHKFKERIDRLKANPKLTCAGCATAINIDANQMSAEMAKVEKSLADLKRTLGRLDK
jgi:transcription elongation factor Elf1